MRRENMKVGDYVALGETHYPKGMVISRITVGGTGYLIVKWPDGTQQKHKPKELRKI
jgi:hypothetical protein